MNKKNNLAQASVQVYKEESKIIRSELDHGSSDYCRKVVELGRNHVDYYNSYNNQIISNAESLPKLFSKNNSQEGITISQKIVEHKSISNEAK